MLPPRGLGNMDLDRVQREIRGQCERIDPKYPRRIGLSLILSRPLRRPSLTLSTIVPTKKGSQPRCIYTRTGLEITSYPGPVGGITKENLAPGRPTPQAPARNRRVGELLKELRLAEKRGAGLPKIRRAMRNNGSPEREFDFDEARTYFRTTLRSHPSYRVLEALGEAGRPMGPR